ncbi:hypothetical protein B0O99DRAFT_649922 [Bisporella sp. PMI_857]|nr:hypothetical protein B0O99DRAFT_649922 [Bisporella sp. PMI_857]
MLPPIDDSVLESNPKFASFHKVLEGALLNPNGSTKHPSTQKERAAVAEALKTARLHNTKKYILQIALKELNLSPPSERDTASPLPIELIELIILFSARLSTPSLAPSSLRILESTTEWAALDSHIPTIASLLSSHLHSQALALVRIQSPATNASYLHRGIPKLVPNIQSLKKEIADRKKELEKQRLVLVSKTTTLLSIYHLATTLIIRILEQTKHGSIARHIKTKAEFLNLSAKQTDLEVQEKAIRGEKLVYTPEAVDALQNYMRNLRDGQDRLRERERDAKKVLWGYGVGRDDGGEKQRIMREISRVYGDLVKEVREVGKDVKLMAKA